MKKLKKFFLDNVTCFSKTLLLLSFISAGHDLLTGASISARFIPNFACPPIFLASTILEAIKLIGWSTLLIGFTLNSLNKKMLGLTFSELIKETNGEYAKFAVYHIIATILCVSTAAAGMSESALISFASVLFFLYYQWLVISSIVINPDNCEIIACNEWDKRLRNSTYSLDDSLDRLSNSLPLPNEKQYITHLNCIAKGLLIYTKSPITIDLRKVINICGILFSKHESKRNDSTVKDLFASIFKFIDDENNLDSGNSLCFIGCAFLVQQIEQISAIHGEDKSPAEILHTILKRIAILIYELENEFSLEKPQLLSKFKNCLWTNYTLLVWIYLLQGNIKIDRSLLPDFDFVTDFSFSAHVVDCLFIPQTEIGKADIAECFRLAKKQVQIRAARR